MPVDAVKIPQNVQIEDKIVGPLSLRQIIIMTLGGGFSYMLYVSAQKSMGNIGIPLTILLWIPAFVAAAFAIVNINDLSLTRICFLLLERTQKPGKRTWGPRTGISITIRTSAVKEPTPVAAPSSAPSASQQIAELSSVVDRTAPASISTATPETAVATANPSEPETEPACRPELPEERRLEPAASPPKPPVNPERIQVDTPVPLPAPQLSDLSVFRDIFPPTT